MLDQRLSWRGRRIAWGRLGSGPPVVLCHGTPWSSALWAPIARALSADHTVYLWDMPGYGASSMDPAHAVDLGLQGELLAHMLATWDLQRPHVVAHDYGGAVALRAHLLHGRPMASMFLVDVVALAPWGSEFFRLVRQHAEVFAALPAPIHRSVVRGYIAGASHRGLRPEELEMLCAPWLTGPGQAAFYRQMAEADQRYTDEFADRLDRIDAPVRVVWGREDTWIPAEQGERLASAVPGATLGLVEDSGHLIQLDAPAVLAAELSRWLASVR
ncbi:alpha/beta fold hydrolase [Georgenia deserti]|uniref:Alpha/beta fold hydrolase n=1 Tax=Georgenia deserti TaxID=2093781 RepID=A0ABW4L5N4_9MICO